MRIAILQTTSGIDPTTNTDTIIGAIAQAKKDGADMLVAPEMAVLLDADRERSQTHLKHESESEPLAAIQSAAKENGLWVIPGSLPLMSESDPGKRVNRAVVIDDRGGIRARYDKIHRFDVTLANGEKWRESNTYAAGNRVVTVDTQWGRIGLCICYDLRFPALFDALGKLLCDMIVIPSAFTVPTGQDHWHVLLRARAIENSCFIVAPAQTGLHQDGRRTYGHSLTVNPWGRVLCDMGMSPSLATVELDMSEIKKTRDQIPSLDHRVPIGN